MMMNKTISVKKVTALILFLTFPLSARIAAGQARDDIQEYLNLKFAAYCKNFPWEEVYVHTDRDNIYQERLCGSTHGCLKSPALDCQKGAICFILKF